MSPVTAERSLSRRTRSAVEPLESRLLFAVVGVGKGLVGNYFSDNNLQNLALARTDATVNFTFGTGAPASGVPAEGFSARWTGQVLAGVTQLYRFHLDSAGGARLKFGAQVEVPDEFILLLSCFDGSLMRRCFVAWREEKEIGVQFRGA